METTDISPNSSTALIPSISAWCKPLNFKDSHAGDNDCSDTLINTENKLLKTLAKTFSFFLVQVIILIEVTLFLINLITLLAVLGQTGTR